VACLCAADSNSWKWKHLRRFFFWVTENKGLLTRIALRLPIWIHFCPDYSNKHNFLNPVLQISFICNFAVQNFTHFVNIYTAPQNALTTKTGFNMNNLKALHFRKLCPVNRASISWYFRGGKNDCSFMLHLTNKRVFGNYGVAHTVASLLLNIIHFCTVLFLLFYLQAFLFLLEFERFSLPFCQF